MLDYMRALRKWFVEEPDCRGIETEIGELHRSLRKKLHKRNRRKLLKLIDLESELQDEISVANFLSGFKLAWGIAQELNQSGQYSFETEEESRACELAEEVSERG